MIGIDPSCSRVIFCFDLDLTSAFFSFLSGSWFCSVIPFPFFSSSVSLTSSLPGSSGSLHCCLSASGTQQATESDDKAQASSTSSWKKRCRLDNQIHPDPEIHSQNCQLSLHRRSLSPSRYPPPPPRSPFCCAHLLHTLLIHRTPIFLGMLQVSSDLSPLPRDARCESTAAS